MAANKWTPKPITEAAIIALETVMPDSQITEYGTPEHLALMRYAIRDGCCTKRSVKVPKLAKDGKPELVDGKPVMVDGVEFVLDYGKLKDWMDSEQTFLGYASNAKKLLQEYGTLDKKAVKPGRGYE